MDARLPSTPASVGSLAAHALTVDDVEGRPGVVLDDGVLVVELSEAFGSPERIAACYRSVAATLLARAEMLDARGSTRNRGWI